MGGRDNALHHVSLMPEGRVIGIDVGPEGVGLHHLRHAHGSGGR